MLRHSAICLVLLHACVYGPLELPPPSSPTDDSGDLVSGDAWGDPLEGDAWGDPLQGDAWGDPLQGDGWGDPGDTHLGDPIVHLPGDLQVWPGDTNKCVLDGVCSCEEVLVTGCAQDCISECVDPRNGLLKLEMCGDGTCGICEAAETCPADCEHPPPC